MNNGFDPYVMGGQQNAMAMQSQAYGMHSLKTAKEMRDYAASTVRQRIASLARQIQELPVLEAQKAELEQFLEELTRE
jgi:hypothetical protein